MIDFTNLPQYFLLGSLGALSVEIVRVYELKHKLHYKKYQKIYKSLLFWIVVIAFFSISGFFTWIMNENNPNVTPWQLFFTGMGSSALIKKFAEGLYSKKELDAGSDNEQLELKDLLS